MTAIRIAFDGTSYRAQTTGASRRTCALLPRLAKLGWEPILFVAQSEAGFYRNLPGVRLETVPTPHLRGPMRNWAAQRWLYPKVKTLGCKIFCTETSPTTLPDLPLVLTVHDLRSWVAPDSVPFLRRNWIRRTLPRALRAASKILTVSQTTAEDLQKHFPKLESTTIPNGGDHFAKPNPPMPPRESFLLSVGPWDSLSRPQDLLAARAAIPNPPPLVFVGAPHQCGNTRDGIKIYSNPNDTELVDLYRRAAVTVCTSVHEGFNLPLLEALGQGCPVLATDLAAHREVGGNVIQRYPSGNTEALTKALLAILDHPSSCSDLQKQADLFSWDSSANRFSQLLHEVL